MIGRFLLFRVASSGGFDSEDVARLVPFFGLFLFVFFLFFFSS